MHNFSGRFPHLLLTVINFCSNSLTLQLLPVVYGSQIPRGPLDIILDLGGGGVLCNITLLLGKTFCLC